MTDERIHDTPRRGELPAEVGRDLAQWRESTARDVSDLRTAVARARIERDAASPWRKFMNANRPWLIPAAGAAVLALALLVVPVSFERTTGDRVTLTLASVEHATAIPAIAREMKAALHASSVRVEGAGDQIVFVADVPRTSRVNALQTASAFAGALDARGYEASVTTAPIREKVSGNVYAFARENVIRVEVADKSAAQIESEIRSQLAAAGIPDAQVSVSTGDGDRKKVTMEVHRTPPSSGEPSAPVRVELTKDGEDLAKKGNTVNIRMSQAPGGGKTLHLTIGSEGQSNTFDIEHVETMNDAQLSAAIGEKLRAAGMTGIDLKVEGGRISVESMR